MIISLLSLSTSLFLTKIKQVFWEVPIDLLEKIQFVSNLFLRKIKIIWITRAHLKLIAGKLGDYSFMWFGYVSWLHRAPKLPLRNEQK